MAPGFLGCNPIGVEEYRVNFDYDLSRHPVGLSAHGLDPWGRQGPIVPQAPEFERFLWPCSLGKRHTGWECWGGRPPTASNVPGCDVVTTQPRGAVRMTIIRIGLDTSKHVFQIHGVDENEPPVLRRQLRRSEVEKFFAKLAPTRIGLEACGASHYWARRL